MATNRRDIELLISAKETTGRSFQQVSSNIAELNDLLAKQVVQAQKGEISLNELRQTQEKLAQAGRDLASIQGQVDAYNRLVASTDKVEKSATTAAAKLEAFKTELASSEKTTEAQERKLQRLEAAVTKTGAALDRNRADVAAQAEVLQRAGIATDQLETAQTGVVNSARQVGAGLVQANAAIDGFAANVTRLKDAEQALAAQSGFDRKIAEAQRLGEASRFVQLFGDAIQTAKTADNQLAALTGFRAVGQMASEAANDVSRFVQSGEAMAVSATRVAAGLQAIIDPSAAALRNLDGVEQAIRDADAASAAGVKNATILNNAYNNLAEASAALLRQGALVDSFKQQEAQVALTRAQFEQAQADVRRLGQAMQQADVPTEELARDLAAAEARLETAGRALAADEARLGTFTIALRDAGINTEDLTAELQRLEAAATTTGDAMARIEAATGRNGARTNGFLGLKPQDLVNVGYQVNDIVVSLMSGQKPLTVFVQQGAQLAQIPGFLSAIAGMAARFAPLIAAALAVAAALREMYTDAERFKQAQKDLATLPNGGALDPASYAAAQEALEILGIKAEDARKAMLAFASEGFPLDQITEYTTAAAQLAERLGVDVTQATEMLIGVQQGGIDVVYDLAEKTHDLTTADLDHAEALFEAGKAAEARQFVLDRVAERNAQIAKDSQSIWTPAVNNLKTAWSNFIGWLGSWVAPILDRINGLVLTAARNITFLTGLMAGKGIDEALAQSNAVGVKTPQARGENDQQLRDRRYTADLEDQYVIQKNLTREQRLQRAEAEARAKAQAAGVSKSVEDLAAAKARTAEEYKLNQEAEKGSKKRDAAAAKAARAAKAEQNRREAAQRQLANQLRQLDRAALSGSSASLAERLEAIDEKYGSIYDSMKKLQGLGVSTGPDGRSLAEITKEVEATKQRLKDEATIKFYQEQANLLTKQRSDEIDRLNDKQVRGAVSVKDAVAEAAEINGRLSPQIVTAAQQALTIAKQIAGANPSPEMVSWIASLERIITNEGSSDIVAKVGLEGLSVQSDKLNDLLKQRDELVSGYQTLYQLGVRTAGETRTALSTAFKDSATDIQPVLDQLRQMVELLHQQKDELTGLPILTDTAYASWLAKIDAVNAGLTQQTTTLSTLETQVFNGVAQAGVNAFDSLTNGLAGVIRGTESWGDAFEAVGMSILQTLADITAAIAQAIIKFLILRALEAAAGLPPGTLSGGGSAGGGLFGLFHNGGTVGGSSATVRSGVSPLAFAGAPRFHDGTAAGLGLRKDEYAAVLKKGEEVLTEDDSRHVSNFGQGGGGGGGQAPSLKQVLVLQPEEIANAMQGRAGQRTIVTAIRANKETIKQMLK